MKNISSSSFPYFFKQCIRLLWLQVFLNNPLLAMEQGLEAEASEAGSIQIDSNSPKIPLCEDNPDHLPAFLESLDFSTADPAMLFSFIEKWQKLLPEQIEVLKQHLIAAHAQTQFLFRMMTSATNIETLLFLLDSGLDIALYDKEGKTILHHAAKQQCSNDLLCLLLAKIPPEVLTKFLQHKDNERLTPLDYAMEKRNTQHFIYFLNVNASSCSTTIASKFYMNCVLKNPDNTILQEAFISLMRQNSEVEWDVSLLYMMPSTVTVPKAEGVQCQSAVYKHVKIPTAVKDQIIDGREELVAGRMYGRIVASSVMPDSAFLSGQQNQCQGQNNSIPSCLIPHYLNFKPYPSWPGMEEAVGRLTRAIFGFGAPCTDLIKVAGMPILVSQGIQGDTLAEVLQNKPHILNKLDAGSVSSLILMAMLVNPEDGRPENYIVQEYPHRSGKYRLVCIDNSRSFVHAFVSNKPVEKGGLDGWVDKLWGNSQPPIVQTKTILYCLNEMNHSVAPEVVRRLLEINPYELLGRWLKSLKRIDASYGLDDEHTGLFSLSEQAVFLKNEKTYIGVVFPEGAIASLYGRLLAFQQCLREEPTIKHIDLLLKLEPLLGERYHSALSIPTIWERFKAVDAQFYGMDKHGYYTTLTSSQDILLSFIPTIDRGVFDVKGEDLQKAANILENTKKSHGVESALQELEKAHRQMRAVAHSQNVGQCGAVDYTNLTDQEKLSLATQPEVSLRRKDLSIYNLKSLLPTIQGNSSLTSLDLFKSNIGPEEVKILISILTLRNLKLEENRVGDKGAELFEANTTLDTLNLSKNGITDFGTSYLARNTTLQELWLYGNHITDFGAFTFFPNRNLKKLDLRRNQIGNPGTQAIALIKTLQVIFLGRNAAITDDGAKTFVGKDNFVHVELKDTNVSVEVVKLFEQVFPQNGFLIRLRRPVLTYLPSIPLPPSNYLPTRNETVCLLSIDGGGIRGLIPALILQQLEKNLVAKLGQPVSLAQAFDWIIGTSTGGLIALGLNVPCEDAPAQPRYSAGKLVELYQKFGKEIFPRPWHLGLFQATYNPKPLENLLNDYFGDVYLSQTVGNILVTTYNMGEDTPYLFNSLEAHKPEQDFLVRDVARSTSAAPTYFPTAQVRNRKQKPYRFIDGGVYANNPTVPGVQHIQKLYPHARKIVVLSLGTGEGLPDRALSQLDNAGKLDWLPKIVPHLMSNAAKFTEETLKSCIQHDPRLECIRIQTRLAESETDMDNVSSQNIQALTNAAQATIRAHKEDIEKVAAILAKNLCSASSSPSNG